MSTAPPPTSSHDMTKLIVGILSKLEANWIELIGTTLHHAFERGIAYSIEYGLYLGPALMLPFINSQPLENIRVVVVIDRTMSPTKVISDRDRKDLKEWFSVNFCGLPQEEVLIVPLALDSETGTTAWHELTSHIVRIVCTENDCTTVLAMSSSRYEHLFVNVPRMVRCDNVFFPPIRLYADGACTGMNLADHLRTASWAFCIVQQGHKDIAQNQPLTGRQTNICAEMTAVLKGLQWIKERLEHRGRLIYIYTDSRFAIDVVTSWIDKWLNDPEGTGYAKKKNVDLILALKFAYDDLGGKDVVKFIHVRAHQPQPDHNNPAWEHWRYNDMVDKLASSLVARPKTPKLKAATPTRR